MTSCDKKGLDCTYIFELPYCVRKPLNDILNLNSTWEILAGKMGYTANEVLQFRQAALQNQNHGDILLNVWGSRGHKVEQLLKLLIKIDETAAVNILLPIVSRETKEKAACWLADRQRQRSSADNGLITSLNQEIVTFLQHSVQMASYGPKTSLPCSRNRDETSYKENSNILERKSNGQYSAKDWECHESLGDPLMAINIHNALRINYEDLRLATDQFSTRNILGHGGYGVVYKGHWKYNLVAVKRLGVTKLASGQVVRKQSAMTNNEGFREVCSYHVGTCTYFPARLYLYFYGLCRQSMAELETLALCRHDNILPLYGYCFNGAECCVVYQFMACGSLDDRLFGKGIDGTEFLNYRRRLRIARGIACGLNYLHTCFKEPLIHGDVKPANILLDSCSEPKLGDFGLCRRGSIETSDSPMIASHIKGTWAYLPPEFIQSKILTTKLDVYSVGMVFFELATAMRSYSNFRKPSNLSEFMKVKRNEACNKQQFTALADPKLQNSNEKWEESFQALIELGFMCVECDRDRRPTACQIVNWLDDQISLTS